MRFLSRSPFAFATATLAMLTTFAAATTPAAYAQVIVGNNQNTANQLPFTTRYVGEYQQVFAASAFSSPVTITQIAFASSAFSEPGVLGAFNFTGTLSLGTTSATPAAPGTSYAANKRADFTTVFNGTQSATLLGTGAFDLVFNVTPFTYNPANGNLLLDVVTANQTSNNGPVPLFVSGTGESLLGRLYNAGGNGPVTAGANEGLRTRFTLSAAAVPEPRTLALLGMGALPAACTVIVRRRARKA